MNGGDGPSLSIITTMGYGNQGWEPRGRAFGKDRHRGIFGQISANSPKWQFMVNIPIGFDVAIMVVRARVPLPFSQHFDLAFALHRFAVWGYFFAVPPLSAPLVEGVQ